MALLDNSPNLLLNVGLGLLSQGPSRLPVNPWRGVTQGILATQGQRTAQAQEAQRAEQERRAAEQFKLQQQIQQQQLYQAHIKNAQDAATREHIARGDYKSAYPELYAQQQFAAGKDTANIREYEYAKNDPAFKQFIAQTGGGTDQHKDILRFRAYQKMSPEEKREFMMVQRAAPWLNQGSAYVQPGQVDPNETTGIVTKDLAPENLPETRKAQASATAVGTASGTAKAAIPAQSRKIVQIRKQVAELKNHPGKGDAVGSAIKAYTPAMPGGDKADFLKRKEQIEGGAFLAARQELKGGGSISDVESLRAEQAFIRMSRAQSVEDFDTALDEFLSAVEDGYAALQEVAGMTENIPPPRSESDVLQAADAILGGK